MPNWTQIAASMEEFWSSEVVSGKRREIEKRLLSGEGVTNEDVQYLRGWLACYEFLRELAPQRSRNARIVDGYRNEDSESRSDAAGTTVPTGMSRRSAHPA